MPLLVGFDVEFKGEFKAYDNEVKLEIRALVEILKQFGPEYGRPRVDTLESKKHANLKELRFSAADGEWRVAFAFDPERKANLLVGGDQSGVSQTRFYKNLVKVAEARFDAHLKRLEESKKNAKENKKENK